MVHIYLLIHKLLQYTDNQLLGLCLDTGHYCYGGGNPIEALMHYRDRIWHIHLKDFDFKIAEKARDQMYPDILGEPKRKKFSARIFRSGND